MDLTIELDLFLSRSL